MIQPLIITTLPVVFLIVLFGGKELLHRKKICMGGKPPINKTLFYFSKYLVPGLWLVMILHSRGINLSFYNVPSSIKGISFFLWIVGFTLLFIGRFGLGSSFRIDSPKEKTDLKVNGLFKYSRNPMYVGMHATLLASVIYTANPIFLLICLFVIGVHHKIILAEEQFLQNNFGHEFTNYCSRVRRYL